MNRASENFLAAQRSVPDLGEDAEPHLMDRAPERESSMPPGAGIVIAVIVGACGWVLLIALLSGPRT